MSELWLSGSAQAGVHGVSSRAPVQGSGRRWPPQVLPISRPHPLPGGSTWLPSGGLQRNGRSRDVPEGGSRGPGPWSPAGAPL